MKRREFIVGLGTAAAWSLAAQAQPTGRMRRLGVLIGVPKDIPDALVELRALRSGLAERN